MERVEACDGEGGGVMERVEACDGEGGGVMERVEACDARHKTAPNSYRTDMK